MNREMNCELKSRAVLRRSSRSWQSWAFTGLTAFSFNAYSQEAPQLSDMPAVSAAVEELRLDLERVLVPVGEAARRILNPEHPRVKLLTLLIDRRDEAVEVQNLISQNLQNPAATVDMVARFSRGLQSSVVRAAEWGAAGAIRLSLRELASKARTLGAIYKDGFDERFDVPTVRQRTARLVVAGRAAVRAAEDSIRNGGRNYASVEIAKRFREATVRLDREVASDAMDIEFVRRLYRQVKSLLSELRVDVPDANSQLRVLDEYFVNSALFRP